MHHDSALTAAVLLLAAMAVCVPLTKRLGLGAVLGYLAAGALVGPGMLNLVEDAGTILQISELGVVMLLFVIGLELSPARLWVMRRLVFANGLLQVGITTVLIALLTRLLIPDWTAAWVIGFALALSSTAFCLQILAERKDLTTGYGRASFGILLFQDFAAIPALAIVPLLGAGVATGQGGELLPVLRAIGVIALVILGGRYLLRPTLRIVARAEVVELFAAVALLVVLGTALLMHMAGLSMGLGAFLAGVLLADSEFRHEIESHVQPFKGLLLGLFFVAVGMSADFGTLRDAPLQILGLCLGLIVLKFAVLYAIAGFAGVPATQRLLFAALLAQGGEFAFVVFNAATSVHLLTPELHNLLVLVVTLSMIATPMLVAIAARASNRRARAEEHAFDAIDSHESQVIIAGFGRIGQIVGRILTAHRIPFTALESSHEQVDFVRRFGNKVFYGDPSRLDLLRSAHPEHARVIVIANDDPKAGVHMVEMVRRHYPDLTILARARNRQHAFALMEAGAHKVVRETFHSSLVMSRHALEALGIPHSTAHEHIERFREHDEQLLVSQADYKDNEESLIQSSIEARKELENLFEADKR